MSKPKPDVSASLPLPKTIPEVFPNFHDELREYVEESPRPDLAGQIYSLKILSICECDDTGCATFYTAPKPDGAWGPHHYNVCLESERGLMVLDVLQENIVAVEILGRPDLKTILVAGSAS